MSPKALGVIAVAFAILVANAWIATRRREHDKESVVTLREQIRVTDTAFVHDTIRLSTSQKYYRAVRDTLGKYKTDTLLVTRFIAAADSALAACDTALATANRRVALRDTLIREIPKALQPKPLQFHAEAFTDRTVRVGASLRVVRSFALTAEVEQRAGVPLTGRVGARITF